MQRSLMNASARQELLDRLEGLAPDAAPRWGTMSAPRMLAHLADWMLMARGELKTAPKDKVLQYPPLKQLAIYWLPIPKNLPTAPELIARGPGEWSSELRDLCGQLEAVVRRGPGGVAAIHPAFGRMTAKGWGVLVYRHMDHHLRQFGA
jgi:hypothetical protein